MTSVSFEKFLSSLKDTNKLDHYPVLKNLSLADRQVFYHACLAMDVASWDGYVNNIVREYNSCIGNLSNNSLMNFRTSHQPLVERRLEKFNTPNFDNTRVLIIECTGFDPVVIWNWPKKAMIWQGVKSRLNEVLKIRHSFAHGLTFPSYTWLPAKNGRPYLNKSTISEVEDLLIHLAKSLDEALKLHMLAQYAGDCSPWR